MHYFSYQDNQLCAEDVKCIDLAEQFGTPLYVYSTRTLRRHVHILKKALDGLQYSIAFAIKSNDAIGVIQTIAAEAVGADIVSAGELNRACLAGINPAEIVFSGVGKTKNEMEYAISKGVKQLNVESAEELLALANLSNDMQKKVNVALRLNPNVSAGGHEKISTGKDQDKFGISFEQATGLFEKFGNHDYLTIVGVAIHIGSQISHLDPFEEAICKTKSFVLDLQSSGFEIKSFDVGGGLAVPYDPMEAEPALPVEYGTMLKRCLGDMPWEIIVEPGRLITANSGILLSRIIRIKEGKLTPFLILDAGMNDLMRPALYGAFHDIKPVTKHKKANRRDYDVVGPICETTDCFAKNRSLPSLTEGELVAIMSSGAYGFVQANTYNSRPLPKEVLVDGDQIKLLRPVQSAQQLAKAELEFLSSQSEDN